MLIQLLYGSLLIFTVLAQLNTSSRDYAHHTHTHTQTLTVDVKNTHTLEEMMDAETSVKRGVTR